MLTDGRRTDSRWGGSVVVDAGHALYLGSAGDSKAHRHHAVQLCIAVDRSVHLEVEGKPGRYRGVLIGPNVEHRIDGQGERVALYYVEASSDDGAALQGYLEHEPARRLPATACVALCRLSGHVPRPPALLAEWRACVTSALNLRAPRLASDDLEIQSAIRALEAAFPRAISIADLADLVGLRQRVLSVRFRERTGMSVRAFVLWLRLKAAVNRLAERGNLTEAAHAAGFADGAHLCRTFVRMFGVAPSAGLSGFQSRDASGHEDADAAPAPVLPRKGANSCAK